MKINNVHIFEYFTLGFWQYVFSRQYHGGERPSLLMIWCRFVGHPGVVFYNTSGYEPDMRCKRCGEDLG